MRRRGFRREAPDDGQAYFTKQALLDAGEISSKTFDMIRKAARIKGPGHGGLTWPFSTADVITLIRCAEGGRFTERGAPAAIGWRALLGEAGIDPDA